MKIVNDIFIECYCGHKTKTILGDDRGNSVHWCEKCGSIAIMNTLFNPDGTTCEEPCIHETLVPVVSRNKPKQETEFCNLRSQE